MSILEMFDCRSKCPYLTVGLSVHIRRLTVGLNVHIKDV